MDIDNFEFDDKEAEAIAAKLEAKLLEDEQPVEQDEEDCESCKI